MQGIVQAAAAALLAGWLAPPLVVVHAQPLVRDRRLAGRYYRLGTARSELLGRWETELADSVWTSRYTSVDDSVAVDDTLCWDGERIACCVPSSSSGATARSARSTRSSSSRRACRAWTGRRDPRASARRGFHRP